VGHLHGAEHRLNQAYIGKGVHDPGRRPRAATPAAVYDADPDTWPPLMDEKTFYAARRVLTDPKRKTTRPGGARHLLSLTARCGACGGLLRSATRAARVHRSISATHRNS
jgi:hypothetical protein